MDALIWIGAAVSLLGLAGLIGCIVIVVRARKAGLLEDELGLWEQRDLLLAKLLECKTFKDAAVVLRGLSVQADRSYARRAGLDEAFIGLAPDLLTGVTAIDVRDVADPSKFVCSGKVLWYSHVMGVEL